jgi:hypothetical protein
MKRLNLAPSVLIGCSLLIALGCILIFVNPVALIVNVATVNRVRNELPNAKARWLSNQITDYEMDVEGFAPLLCSYNAYLSVQDNKLTSVAITEYFSDKTSPLVPLNPTQWDAPQRCSYSKLVATSMFDQVEQDLGINVWDASLNVEFDDQYGYVSDYEVRYGYRTGGVSECCIWFKFRNFRPIPK